MGTSDNAASVALPPVTAVELAAAMGFPCGYRFPPKKKDAIRMIGNAVCVNLAAALFFSILGPALGAL